MAIDMEAFDTACTRVESVLPNTLKKAIISVYRKWSKDLQQVPRTQINFHGYYEPVLTELGIEDETSAKQYRSALGIFFGIRSQKAKKDRAKIPPLPSRNNVEEADEQEVLIRVVPEISVRFRASAVHGKLDWPQVKAVRRRVHYGPKDARPPEQDLQKAARQALTIMNEKRGFKRRTRKRNL